MRKIIQALLIVLALLAGGLAWVSRAPYDVPEPRYLQPRGELEPAAARREPASTVVLLIFDGLAPATLRAADTPNLDRMAREGAHTADMRPVFPSLSMPNHFSLSTGCQPARHGIVANHFLDPQRGINVPRGDADWLLDCEPLHVAAERQGIRSAVLGWAGSASGERGKLATIAEPYRSPAPSPERRIDQVIELLDAEPRPGYIAAYSTQPDGAGHVHGPLAPETIAVLESIDAQVGRLMAALQERDLTGEVSLLLVSDHGMVDVEGMLNVNHLVRAAGVEGLVVGEGSVAFVHLDDPADRDQALQALSGGAHHDVIDPRDPPPHVHMGTSPRVGDLIIAAHEGYWIADVATWPWHLRWSSYVAGEVIHNDRFEGMHGYDPERVPGVRSVFFAWGAGIAPGVQIPEMRAVDLHPTAAALLGIEPGTPVDGVAREEIFATADHDGDAGAP